MAFDDYNYSAINPHVLLKQPEDISKIVDEIGERMSLG